jgi:hypothetical protein
MKWHDLPIKFHKNIPLGLIIIAGTQNDDLMSLTIFKESRPISAFGLDLAHSGQYKIGK